MPKRNGRSDYLCPSCRKPIGHTRRTAILLQSFTPVPGATVKYLTGGCLEVHCPNCHKTSRINWVTARVM